MCHIHPSTNYKLQCGEGMLQWKLKGKLVCVALHIAEAGPSIVCKRSEETHSCGRLCLPLKCTQRGDCCACTYRILIDVSALFLSIWFVPGTLVSTLVTCMSVWSLNQGATCYMYMNLCTATDIIYCISPFRCFGCRARISELEESFPWGIVASSCGCNIEH